MATVSADHPRAKQQAFLERAGRERLADSQTQPRSWHEKWNLQPAVYNIDSDEFDRTRAELTPGTIEESKEPGKGGVASLHLPLMVSGESVEAQRVGGDGRPPFELHDVMVVVFDPF